MKISKYLALGLLTLSLTPVWGQNNGILVFGQQPLTEATNLTKFNLDFPGGTPKELIAAIEKATGKPLNAIIPDEDTATQLPSLKMNDVNVPELFRALTPASSKQMRIDSSDHNSYSLYNSSYGFKTEGELSDNSIWYFFEDKPTTHPEILPEKKCRFYQLAPYLNNGLTVDDITTAIQTGWKMEGETSPPEISFHKETQLLIAVGESDKLEVIDDVLKALQPPPENPLSFQKRLQNIVKTEVIQQPAGAPSIVREYFSQSTNSIPPASAPPVQNLPAEKSGK